MTSTVYLCEKPDQGRHIAKALGGGRAGDGHIVCGETIITWGYGHLLAPKMPEDYDPRLKAWSFETLPIVPDKFEFQPRQGGAEKQLKMIAGLIRCANAVVIATDADREGELIAYLILDACGWRGPTQRLWLSDLTPAAVKKALGALKPGAETKPLYHAALARSCADWLVGMNLSRAATLKLRAGSGKPLSVGRVQTPTLGLIVRLERKIQAFKSGNFYELTAAAATSGGQTLTLRYAPAADKRITDKAAADALAAQAAGAGGALEVATEEKTQAPPTLFDLSGLQQEANARFGWSADHTLKVAQALYEARQVLTYPRTDSTALPVDHKTRAAAIIKNLLAMADLAQLRGELMAPEMRSTVYDDAKVSAHHAIVPTLTAADLSALSADERALYLLVARSFLAAHMADHSYLATTIELDANGVSLRAAGRQSLYAGWRAAFAGVPNAEEERGEVDEPAASTPLPAVKNGELARVETVRVDTKKTKPPARFTEKSLLKAMKNVAQYVDDPAAKRRLKETSGIGTPATRAGIIETLKARDYIRAVKRQIQPTETGMAVIAALEAVCPAYCAPAETAAWEDRLEEIAIGKAGDGDFIAAIAAKVRVDVSALQGAAGVLRVVQPMPSTAPARGREKGKSKAAPQAPGRPFEPNPERARRLAAGTPLKVAYDARERAKALGALWDADRRVWVAPPGTDLSGFRRAGFLSA